MSADHLYSFRTSGMDLYSAQGELHVMDDFGGLQPSPFDLRYVYLEQELHEVDDASWRLYWQDMGIPAQALPAPVRVITLTPSAARELRRIEAKLEAWELQHLRALCAEQAQRIESLEQALSSAQLSADLWGDLAREAQDALHEAGVGAMGITREGQAVFMPAAPAPTAWQPV